MCCKIQGYIVQKSEKKPVVNKDEEPQELLT